MEEIIPTRSDNFGFKSVLLLPVESQTRLLQSFIYENVLVKMSKSDDDVTICALFFNTGGCQFVLDNSHIFQEE